MKLIYAIVRKEDGNLVTEELTRSGFSVTRIASTGGFLRRGNMTLMIVTEPERVDEAVRIIKKECGERRQVVFENPYPGAAGAAGTVFSGAEVPLPVDTGGATIFVVEVERFERV
ncbi:MAG: cyclic-di-AMP receptor [Lachnospiraceae bacterium]|nr:cyclic-di-AMP receptor [Lachnospiraceae bacterium]